MDSWSTASRSCPGDRKPSPRSCRLSACPHLISWHGFSILTELIGGLAVFLGAFIPLVSLPLAGLLLVAILTVHLPYGFSSIKLISVAGGRAQFGPPGYEVDLLYLACLAALVFAGSGPLAIDDHLRKK